MCSDGVILGNIKFGNVWIIPGTAEIPIDGRVKLDNYMNWRKDKE